MDVTQPRNAGMDGHEQALDLTRGIAAYVNHPLVAGLARVIAKHPNADIANAFNHKQVACKMWALDRLFESRGGRFARIWVLGGWYGILPAMLFNDPRFDIDAIDSIDMDAEVAPVARLPQGTNVLLQSNDYFSEPTHINCVVSLAAFEAMAGLREVRFSGELPTKKYTRFMLIGTV
ncbi:MAG: class I SAM-dependent methyltransferase [Mesorhizobium sp.]|nr:MAG: class I SAM-dependent methyltransferase [Mesorhizobium sp.]